MLGRWIGKFILATLVFVSLVGAAAAQSRIALVIGNSAYRNAQALPTAHGDAAVVAETMRAAGYEVIELRDLHLDDIGPAMRDFLDKVAAAGPQGVAFVYFSGYAAQSQGQNYLVPVDAQIGRDSDVPLQALRLSDLIQEMMSLPAAARLVVLDGARDHGFGRGTAQAVPRGLAVMDVPEGMLIASSAAPGALAVDGDASYSIYTGALVTAMRQPGLDMEQIFKAARLQVNQATGAARRPG